VIEALSEPSPMSVTELQSATGYSQKKLHRILNAFHLRDMFGGQRKKREEYHLGMKLVYFGNKILKNFQFDHHIRRFLLPVAAQYKTDLYLTAFIYGWQIFMYARLVYENGFVYSDPLSEIIPNAQSASARCIFALNDLVKEENCRRSADFTRRINIPEMKREFRTIAGQCCAGPQSGDLINEIAALPVFFYHGVGVSVSIPHAREPISSDLPPALLNALRGASAALGADSTMTARYSAAEKHLAELCAVPHQSDPAECVVQGVV